jgi:bleomycin hydrolase
MKLKQIKKQLLVCISLFLVSTTLAQDKGVFKKAESNYYQQILKDVNAYEEQKATEPENSILAVDHNKKTYPKDPSDYKSVWFNNPVSQGNTSTCWCFSTMSFYESEVKRITGKEVRLSEMYVVYWEYVERAKYFVQNRGEMELGEGSETNAVAKIMKLHGVVPLSSYSGLLPGQKFHSHDKMFSEIESYLSTIKATNAWNENEVVKTVKAILEHHMGQIPNSVAVDGKILTPNDYYLTYLMLNSDNYVNVMSLVKTPYWKKTLYDVPDNWWRSSDYNNVPLTDFVEAVKIAIKNGYSLSVGGDVSEVGFDKSEQVAIIPDFDIPSSHINEFSRQLRFENGTTTDDHAMHLVGFQEINGKTWFLLKDSGSGSRNCGENCKSFGYYFMHEDYLKLKIMTFTVHKNAIADLIKKMQL